MTEREYALIEDEKYGDKCPYCMFGYLRKDDEISNKWNCHFCGREFFDIRNKE